MSEIDDEVRKRLESIRAAIRDACARSGRSVSDITLMAVTKTKPAEVIRSLIALGVRDFGENYPDETAGKIDAFRAVPTDTRLCMIGSLQSRKAKFVAANFDEFHSLDSVKTAERMERLLAELDRTMPALLEINVGGEASKHGWPIGDAADGLFRDIERLLTFSRIIPFGLMTLPPYSPIAEANRGYFARMRELLDRVNRTFGLAWRTLSMGTSDDFETAIEEGATIVRIGTRLVGARDYRRPAEETVK